MVPNPTSEYVNVPMSDVKSSGAEPPAAMNVAPATSGEMANFSTITSSDGTKNLGDEGSTLVCCGVWVFKIARSHSSHTIASPARAREHKDLITMCGSSTPLQSTRAAVKAWDRVTRRADLARVSGVLEVQRRAREDGRLRGARTGQRSMGRRIPDMQLKMWIRRQWVSTS